MDFNTSMGEYLLRKYRKVERPFSFRGSTKEEFLEWRERLKAKLLELLGEFPSPVPLESISLGKVEEENYIREKLLIRTEEDMVVPAYLFIPNDLKKGERRPALICQHGHGHGKDDVAGVTHGEGRRSFTIEHLNYAYAREFAKRGFVVLAPDARGFGERSLGYEHPGKDGCDIILIKSLLLGLNPLTLNLYDLMRCMDYLQERPEVNGERIGCVGLSYGGTLTLYLSALDERIKCAVISCYLNSFYTYALSLGNTCGSQTIPNLLLWMEMEDIACSIAPRPVLYESGLRDEGFPIEEARKAFAKVKRCYELLGEGEKVAMDEFEGGHMFHGALAFDWVERWMRKD